MNDDDARFAVSDRFFLWQEPKGYKVSRSLGRMHSAVDKRYIRIIRTNSPSFTPSSTCVSPPLLLSPPWLQPPVHLLKSRAPWTCSTTFRHCESTCTARVRSCSPPPSRLTPTCRSTLTNIVASNSSVSQCINIPGMLPSRSFCPAHLSSPCDMH